MLSIPLVYGRLVYVTFGLPCRCVAFAGHFIVLPFNMVLVAFLSDNGFDLVFFLVVYFAVRMWRE